MPDLNDLFFFLAIVSPLVVLGRTWRRGAFHRGWQLASLAVLIVTGLAWVIVPRHAGFVGGGAWVLLLFLPSFLFRKGADLAAQQRFVAAGRVLSLLVPLHPSRTLRAQARLFRALGCAQDGDRPGALAQLKQLTPGASQVSRQAEAQGYRITGQWNELLAWCERHLPRVGVGEDPALLPLCLRALGETGHRDELVLQFAGRAPMLLAAPQHQPVFATSLALVFAFCGRTPALARLFETEALHFSDDAKEFWIATSEAAAGETAASRTRLERLRQNTGDGLLRADAAERLARRGLLPPLPLNPSSSATIARLERDVMDSHRPVEPSRSRRATPAVLGLIVLNVLMFLVEIRFGGSTNSFTLHSLGALEPVAVLVGGQYWRMVAALFLHYGPLHLLVNLYALFVLGPSLEHWIGSLRFTLAYFISGIGSSAGVLLLWRYGLTQADLLVGASGSVMGIVGAWAGVLIGHRHAPQARRRLLNIALIVGLQTAFDFYTPQVSMAAHLSGFVSGFLLGLFLQPRSLDADEFVERGAQPLKPGA